MASRKLYEAIAQAIRESDKDVLVQQLCGIFQADNPLFDSAKFKGACGIRRTG